MKDKLYWLEKWKSMQCDFEYNNNICIGNCPLCHVSPDDNLINWEERNDLNEQNRSRI